MKKTLIPALIMLFLLLVLSACGSASPAATPAPAPTAAPTAAPPAPSLSSVLPGSNLQPADTPVESTPAVDEALFKAACDCIDKDVAALYAAIGEPIDSSYAPSCLGITQGGEDGELYYEGFTVATYREGDKEIVRDVNINVG